MRRFFCENCGEEVKENDELCPSCGAVFAAIKCPRCGYRGKVHEFRHGCPSCGFLGEDRVRATRWEAGDEVVPELSAGEKKSSSWWRHLQGVFGNAVSSGSSPPGWLFWLIIFILIAAFAILSVIYTSI